MKRSNLTAGILIVLIMTMNLVSAFAQQDHGRTKGSSYDYYYPQGGSHDLIFGGGITNPIGNEMADNAFLGNGFNVNEGYYYTLFGNTKISGGIVGNVDYYSLSADNGLSRAPQYDVIGGSSTTPSYTGELSRATSFDFLAGPKLSFGLNKFYITPALLLGYQTIKRDAFAISDSVYETGNTENKIYVPLLSSGILKASGFAIKPQLKVGYRITPQWNVWAGYSITLGPTMKNSFNEFVPGGDPDSSGAYYIDQFYGGSTNTKTSDVKWQTGSFNVGISYRFGGKQEANKLTKADAGKVAVPSQTTWVIPPVKPSKTPQLLIPNDPDPNIIYCCTIAFKQSLGYYNNSMNYTECDRYSGYMCAMYGWFPCGTISDGFSGKSASVSVPSLDGFGGDGYVPVKLKLNDMPKGEKLDSIVVTDFTQIDGDLSKSNIKKAVLTPGTYHFDKKGEASLLIYFIQNPLPGSNEPQDDLNGPTTGWCTVKRFRDNNCANNGTNWCGEYTMIRCGGNAVKFENVIAYTPYRVSNPDPKKKDSINLVQLASRSLPQLDSLGQGIAKAWGKKFELENYEGVNYMKFTPLKDNDKEVFIFPIYTPTPSYNIINDGYVCAATNCNCVGDCYCLSAQGTGTCKKGRKVSIAFSNDWTYFYE